LRRVPFQPHNAFIHSCTSTATLTATATARLIITATVTMVDKELLTKKIRKVEGILDDIEEEKGADNKLFRAYHRKLENYHDLLSDASSDGDDNSTNKGSAHSLADSSVEEPSQGGGSVDIKMIEKKYKKVTKILEELEDEHGEEVNDRKDYTKFLKKKMEYAEVLGISAEAPVEPATKNGDDHSNSSSSDSDHEEEKKKKKKPKKKAKDGDEKPKSDKKDKKKKKEKKSKDADEEEKPKSDKEKKKKSSKKK
jgi:hypothetical protein